MKQTMFADEKKSPFSKKGGAKGTIGGGAKLCYHLRGEDRERMEIARAWAPPIPEIELTCPPTKGRGHACRGRGEGVGS